MSQHHMTDKWKVKLNCVSLSPVLLLASGSLKHKKMQNQIDKKDATVSQTTQFCDAGLSVEAGRPNVKGRLQEE